MDVGGLGSFGAARIDHGTPVATIPEPRDYAVEDDRVAVRGVGADEEESIRQLDVGIRAGWSVAAERKSHPTGGAGHAQAAVAVHVVRPQVSLGELGSEV